MLKRFVVTFDYENSTMYLKPFEGLHSDIDTFDRSGMWINAVPEGFKVIDITKGGPAEAAGLAKDDVITAIDGKAATEFFCPTSAKSGATGSRARWYDCPSKAKAM